MTPAVPALLDVNVLVALFDPDHVHHDLAHDWFAEARRDGWATCPLTENGVVRILSNRRYSPVAEPPGRTVARLRAFCQSRDHQFWPDDVSLRTTELFMDAVVYSHQAITDVYLLALAKHHGGRLATFDRAIPVDAVAGASREDLLLIAET
ncbi:MAG: PIN domain-containing protein [Vicinamibacterales bacterium]|nr:PIN domain-containing protein [Vicinamibacterales bacterium]